MDNVLVNNICIHYVLLMNVLFVIYSHILHAGEDQECINNDMKIKGLSKETAMDHLASGKKS